jgi:hypothetical protein
MDCPEVGVVVPGVKTTDPSLAEPRDGARSTRPKYPMPLVEGSPGDMALRLGGESGMREPGPTLEVLSMSGVRSRLGGSQGEYACAGLGLFLFEVRGRAIGVIERGSTSIKAPVGALQTSS